MTKGERFSDRARSFLTVPEGPPAAVVGHHESLAPRRPVTDGAGLLAVGVAFVLPVAFSPEAYHSFWAPKAAVCLLLLGPGLVALVHVLRNGVAGAAPGALFVLVAAASALASDDVVPAFVGSPNWGAGVVFVATLVGAWALGAVAPPGRRHQIVLALVAGASLNAVVAWLQARGLVPPALESPGRSMGLAGNPVHAGALFAGGLWLCGALVRRDRRWAVWLVPVALLAGAAELSGGRSAVGLSALALLVTIARAGHRKGMALLLAAAVGFLAAPRWAGEGAVSAVGRSVGGEATHQVDVRFDVWRIGLEAVAERPVLGWGPGRFQAATSHRSTAEIARGDPGAWKDAHNWVVGYAVTTGLVGLALLAAWLFAAARRARGPLAGFAAIVGLFTLVEPQSVALTPLGLLALGASGPTPPAPAPAWASRRWRVAAGAGLAVGAVAAGVLLWGEVLLGRARLDTSVASYDRGAALLPPWADVSRLGARIESFHGLHDAEHRRRALALAGQATERDPADPATWTYLGQLEMVWGTTDAAARALDRALERNPWLADALEARAVVAERQGEAAALEESCRRLGVLGANPPVCGGPATVTP